MPGLMEDGKTFSKLLNKYKNFLNPAMKIKVNNNDIRDLEVGVPNLTVTLGLSEPSSVDFTVVNVYDLKTSAFIDKVKKQLKLGSIIKVQLGYSSSVEQVFQGYISNVSMSFNTTPSITITALDARALMRVNTRLHYKFKQKKYSEVVKEVLGAYKKECPKVVADDTTEEDPNIMQNDNDLEFIQNVIGQKAKKEFLLFNDTAYFREFGKNKKPITTLELGQGLISLTNSATYRNEQVIIYGHDDKGKKEIEVKKPAKSDSKLPALVSPLPVIEIPSADVEDKNEAAKIVEFEINKRLKKSKGGSGTCIGLPEIIPGRYLKIDKVDPDMNKTYYLKKVIHNFGEDGYTTDFEIGGWL